MKPEDITAIFEYLTGVPLDTMLDNVAKASHIAYMSSKKKRHLKRYLRRYYRHAPNARDAGQAAGIAKAAVRAPDPFSVFSPIYPRTTNRFLV